MDIRFSLEDDSDVDIKIDEDSIQIEIDNPASEVEEGYEKVEAIFSVIENLSTIKNHILKFGITPQFLHLVNTNNSLGSAIGMMLPHYESENENLDQIKEDEIPDVEVVVETIGEAVSKVKTTFMAALKWIWDKLVELGNFLKKLWPFQKQQVKKAKEDLNKDNIANEVAKQTGSEKSTQAIKKATEEVYKKPINDITFNARFISQERGNNLLNKLSLGMNVIYGLTLNDDGTISDKGNGIINVNMLGLSSGGIYTYYVIENDTLITKHATHQEFFQTFPSALKFPIRIDTTDNKDLGWSCDELNKFSDDLIKLMQTFESASGHFLKKHKADLEREIKELENEKTDTDLLKKRITTNKSIIDMYNKCTNRMKDVCNFYVKAVNLAQAAIIKEVIANLNAQ